MDNVAKENKKREDFFEKSLDSFMKQYMSEETPENERIVSYELRGYGSASILEKDGDIGKGTISFVVEPYSQKNTIWSNKKEWINNGAYTLYIKFSKENDEYVAQNMSLIPEHYEKFIAEFEKYKAKLPEEKFETEAIQAEVQENYLANQEIETMSKGIFIFCGIVLFLSVCICVRILRKRR